MTTVTKHLTIPAFTQADWDIHPEDDFDAEAADRWNDAAFWRSWWNDAALAALRGQPCPGDDADSLEGYRHGLEESKKRVVLPARPEGYYHLPLGTFD